MVNGWCGGIRVEEEIEVSGNELWLACVPKTIIIGGSYPLEEYPPPLSSLLLLVATGPLYLHSE